MGKAEECVVTLVERRTGYVLIGKLLARTAEDATRREVMEELGVEVSALSFLCTSPNVYPYRGIIYTVCDLFFVAELAEQSFTLAPREVESTIWLAPQAIDLDEIAFSSMRAALTLYRETL